MIKTEFMELCEELDALYEADINAGKKFWAAARNNQIDEVSFHAAYDEELSELGLMDVFNTAGAFTGRSVYGKIKEAKEANPDSWALKALSRLWALRYVEGVYFESEKAEQRAEAERREKERKEAEARRAEEERIAREQKAAQIAKYNEVLKTYISKVDPEIVAAYEKATGISVQDGAAIEEVHSRGFGLTLGLTFKSWGYHYRVNSKDIADEAKMVKLLTQGFEATAKDIRIQKSSDNFKHIDILKARAFATVILLGESGKLYELSNNQGTVTLRNKGKYEPADTIDEPYEVIYAYTYWSDGNRSTYRDSESEYYYSWNSKYADKLSGRIPTKYGREEGYMTSYTETTKTDGAGSNYSHADGIDSWAKAYSVACATD